MSEEWRVIEGFPAYAVSNLGQVKRIIDCPFSKAGRLLRQHPNEKGYLMVKLSDGIVSKTKKVHLLVAYAFNGCRPEGMTANHKNGIKSVNSSDNIEWITHQKNVQHAHENGLCQIMRGEKNGNSKLKTGEVWLIKKLLAESNLSLVTIGKMFRTKKVNIHAIKAGRNWAHIIYP